MPDTQDQIDLVHLTTVHDALDSRIFYREALSAHKGGLRCVVVGPTKTPNLNSHSGISIVSLRQRKNRLLRRIFSPFEAFKKVRALKPKVVHFHDPEILPIAVLLKLLGYKMVWDIHEYYSKVQTAHMRPGLHRSFKQVLLSTLIEKLPCAIFDRSVFPTQALRAAICDKPRAVACVNLLPVAEFPDDKGQPEKEFDLVFMGSMSPFRAGPFMEMLNVLCQRRADLKVALLGVPAATQSWMQGNAPQPRILEAITFVPKVPHSEVAGVLRKARIGFNYHPMEERFQVAIPMKVYEYMACGIAVVCTRFPELDEQLYPGEIVLVEGDDQAAYASAILELLDDEEQREKIALAGQAAVKLRLNWEKREAPKLIKMYQELLT